MHLEHIVVASDESDAGRSAARVAVDLAHRARSRITFMTVIPAEPATALASARPSAVLSRGADLAPDASDRLGQWLNAELESAPPMRAVDVGVAFGIPSVEICRFAEDRRADLLVLGRKPRTRAARLLLGDTADAVARRSQVPSLYVPPGTAPLHRILVALDGTDRGLVVFRFACAAAAAIGASLSIVTVEPSYGNEPESLAAALPTARSLALIDRVATLAKAEGLECLDAGAGNGRGTRDLVVVRRGNIVAQVLDAVVHTAADVLAVGYHRGGPPGSIEGGSVARRLAHEAPCALLAVPL
jgi:nucleotide-binding universal stress UspA family protein